MTFTCSKIQTRSQRPSVRQGPSTSTTTSTVTSPLYSSPSTSFSPPQSPPTASSLTCCYAARLASWSQPKGPAGQSGFRIGRGTFLPFNQSKLILEALFEADLFITQLISASPPITLPLSLSRPLVIPQSFTANPTAHFLRSTSDEFNQYPNGIPVQIFTDFLDILNSLLLAGVGGGCAAADLRSDHEIQPTLPDDYASPPPDYQNQPKPIDRFLLLCNQHLFRPRQVECQILTHDQLRSRLLLPDPLTQMSRDQILQCAQQPSSPRPISTLPTELAPFTLPLKRTRLTHFPTRARPLGQVYRPRPPQRRSTSVARTQAPQSHSSMSQGWASWIAEIERSAKGNLLLAQPTYWILIDTV